MKRLTLAEAAREMRHDHDSLGHGQRGNPFYPWYDECKWACPLCLALMHHDGVDIAMAFSFGMPYAIEPVCANWWQQAYLVALAYIDDQYDREYLRERVAYAIGRGKQAQRDRQARAFMDLRS